LRGNVSTKQFICRSDPAGGNAAPTAQMLSSDIGSFWLNFDNPLNNSYSYAFPWTESSRVGGWWKATSNASIPICADMAPLAGSGSPAAMPQAYDAGKVANSSNHQRQGQTVAFADSHTEFAKNPAVGQRNDNIWTWGGVKGATQTGNTIMGVGMTSVYMSGPAGNYDIVMVPVANVSTNERK
jgi:hypothetical protein